MKSDKKSKGTCCQSDAQAKTKDCGSTKTKDCGSTKTKNCASRQK